MIFIGRNRPKLGEIYVDAGGIKLMTAEKYKCQSSKSKVVQINLIQQILQDTLGYNIHKEYRRANVSLSINYWYSEVKSWLLRTFMRWIALIELKRFNLDFWSIVKPWFRTYIWARMIDDFSDDFSASWDGICAGCVIGYSSIEYMSCQKYLSKTKLLSESPWGDELLGVMQSIKT